MKIYVGNLPFDANEQELREQFEAFGKVASVEIITDKYSGRSKGFAFVEMPSISEGQAAIDGLNGKTLRERTLTINPARPRTESRGPVTRERRGGGPGGGRQRRY
ncbi:MAG: RNA-binding protein [Dehalococcoidia bacterium]|nr:RNA-binding protein [Dehalococcoidia bacterium]